MFGFKNDDTSKDVKFQEKDDKENEVVKLIDKYDMNMLSYLARLYEALNGDKMDFTKIKTAVDALQQFNIKQEYNYLNNLLHPEKCKAVKVPSPIPVPSCSFQLHNCVTLTTNASGNLAAVFNPFFLCSTNALTQKTFGQDTDDEVTFTPSYFSTLWCNADESLSGSEINNHWFPVNIGQVIPPVYDQYRLVSASIVVKYIGRLDIASGVIGGAIIFDENPIIGSGYVIQDASSTTFSLNPSVAKYGNFDLAMDSFYHQENLCLEGLRMLYFPVDNSYEEYTRTIDGTHLNISRTPESTQLIFSADQDYYKSGFNWMIYVLGAPASSTCFKVDIYCNYECLPNASFLNYLPLTMSPMGVSSEEKRRANMIVQKKPVMKLSESAKETSPDEMPSIWAKMKKKFSGALPGIGKLISKGIVKMLPALKPGLALAGAMLDSNGDQKPMEEDVE